MKKRKLFAILTLLTCTLSISGCSFVFRLMDELEDSITGDGSSDANFEKDKTGVDVKTTIKQTYKDLSNNYLYRSIDYCPSSGEINLLVIPVWFNDSSEFVTTSNKETVRSNIHDAYFGTNSDTGWRSVKTYYEELSSGKVTLNGVVSQWYSVSRSYSYYASDEGDANNSIPKTRSLVSSAVDWYFTNNPSDDRANYDSDNNGYLDAVMLIYAAPDYIAYGKKDDEDRYGNLWAYCYWMQEKNETSKPIPNAFFWASYDFMYSKASGFGKKTPAGSTYGSGDTSHCNIDTHTYIHEMGHIFGLDDYYDYGNERYEPAGGFSMQDRNVGCHDPYSVMALGWADPYVITEDSEVTIGTFQKTRDLVLISSNWNNIGSPFDEYILLELFSPTGLNEHDCRYEYSSSIKGPSIIGVRMWHVDARLAYVNKITSDGEPIFSSSQLTSNVKTGTYGTIHAFSNSYNNANYGSVLGSKYYDHNLLQVIRNTPNSSLDRDWNKSTLSSYDLFTGDASGKTYDLSKYSEQFVKQSPFTMNNGSYAKWNLQIKLSGNGENAKATIAIVQ